MKGGLFEMKENNVARSVVLPKSIADKVQQDADNNCSSFNAIVRKILVEYYKNK